jgi:uncharacterized protein YndB with AHSA1/START domain
MSDRTGYGQIIAPAEVRFERLLPGPIETVWAFLTESDKRGQWLASGPMDLRPGGKATLYFDHDTLSPHKASAPEKYKSMQGKMHEGQHTILAVDPPRSFTMTWDATSEVTFELTEKGKLVLLTVTHRKLASRDDMVQVSGGWHTHLDILVERANGRTPAAFWTVFGEIESDYDARYPR